MLLGAIGGPLLQGMGVGATLGLTATQLGAGVAGLTSLIQGNDILTAGLDAFGGYGGAGAIGKLGELGKAGAAQAINTGAANAGASAGTAAAQNVIDDVAKQGMGLMQIPPSTLAAEYQAAAGPAAANFLSSTPLTAPVGAFESAGAGLKDLLSPGGAARFADATGSSALSSVGLPAASLALQSGALMSPPMPGESSLGFGEFTPLSELRERNVSMGYAEGGLADLNPMHGVFDARNAGKEFGEPMGGYKKGGYLDGPGDGMSDDIPATIEGKQPARLADGEFVVPADVVSHLGNGSTKAGAQRLYSMMDKVRKARTGTTKQGKQIKPEKYMPA
jgi:hypothetical protein